MPRRRAVRRRRRTRKSGGTGDRKPQYVSGTLVATSPTTYAATVLEIPLLNILTGGTKVLEILKIQLNRLSGSNAFRIAIGSRTLNGVLDTAYPYTQVGSDRVWFANTIFAANDNNREIDLTDEAGSGQLYPAQQIVVNATGTSNEQLGVRILYRIKNASLQEYVGIINQYVVTTL